MTTFDTSNQQIEELRAIKLQQPEAYQKIVEAVLKIEGWRLERRPIELKDPQIDRVEAYKSNLVRELVTWRNSIDPGFNNKTVYDCCQAILKMIASANSDIELNFLRSGYEGVSITFTGSPIPASKNFEEIECDSQYIAIPHDPAKQPEADTKSKV